MALDRRQIVTEAIALLDEGGLDDLTLRKLAARLGVSQPTLYWHIPNKAALLTDMADTILTQQFPDLLPPDPGTPWQDWLTSMATQLRQALLAHPDSARILSASQLSTQMSAISELMISVLAAQNIPAPTARIIVLTVQRFTVGYVLEEQAPRPDTEALQDFDMADFAAAHPNMTASISEYFKDGRTVDDLYADCLAVVIDGAIGTVSRGRDADRPGEPVR
jgi:TetR/AcrR family tetracycline transcriptional repressor